MSESVKIRLHVMSPIHIGCGEVYEPTSFRVDPEAGKLLTFDPLDLIDSLDDAGRKALEKVSGEDNLLAIMKEIARLATAAKVPALSSVGMAKGLLKHYDTVMKMPTYNKDAVINQFTLERTAYSPNGGFPYIPGSSIKGAIRTAYLNALNKGDKDFRRESDLLGCSFQDDPFRLLKVPDLLPVNLPATRLIYAVNIRKKGGAAKGPFQILETISHGSVFEGVLSLDQPPKTATVKSLPSIKSLLFDLDVFHRDRYREDKTVFDAIENSDALKSLGGRIGKFNNALKETAFLIRIGRHGGAESHTLDGARKIKIKQANNSFKYMDHATTIWLAAEDKKAVKGMPFGWAVLEMLPVDGGVSTCCDRLRDERASESVARRAEAKQKAEVEALRKAAEEERLRKIEAERKRLEAEKEAVRKAEEARLAALSPLDRSIEEVLQKDADPNKKLSIKLFEALKSGRWNGDDTRLVAESIRDRMRKEGEWRENPDPAKAKKDKAIKRTLEVMAFLKG